MLGVVFASHSFAKVNNAAVVKGTVPDYPGYGIMLLLDSHGAVCDTIMPVENNGAFRGQVNNIEESAAFSLYLEYLGDDAGYVELYLSPGKTTEVSVKGVKEFVPLLNKEYYTLRPAFKGANAKECGYLNLQVDDYQFKNADGSPVTFNNYRSQIEKRRQYLRSQLKGCQPKFVEQESSKIENMGNGEEFVYYRRLKNDGHDASKDYDFTEFVRTIDMETCPTRLACDNAQYQLEKDTTLYSNQPFRARFFHYLNDNIKDRQRLEAIADEEMEFILSIGDNIDLKTVFEAYKRCSGNSRKYHYNEEAYNSLVSLNPGVKAADFILKDVNGKDVHFVDVIGQGKVTYIDFWATWCGPCCAEIPYVAELVEKYKGNPNIRFVSVSLDSNIEKWHAKLDRDKPAWDQYVIPDNFNSTFAKEYNVLAIPRFMAFDGEGRIINISEVRPSASNITEILDGYIRKYIK